MAGELLRVNIRVWGKFWLIQPNRIVFEGRSGWSNTEMSYLKWDSNPILPRIGLEPILSGLGGDSNSYSLSWNHMPSLRTSWSSRFLCLAQKEFIKRQSDRKEVGLLISFVKNVAEKLGMRGWSCPRSWESSWDGPLSEDLGFTLGRTQERPIVKWKQRCTICGLNLIYLKRQEHPWEKHTPQTECGPSQKMKVALKYGVVSFHGLGNFIG